MNETLIIICARNEADNIEDVIKDVSYYGCPMVIDDCSSDDTSKKALNAGAQVFRNDERLGIGGSTLRGIANALLLKWPTRVVFMDAGRSHSAEDIPKLLTAMDVHHANCVVGSRAVYTHKRSYRRILSSLGRIVYNFALKRQFKDPTSGFRVYDKLAMLSLMQMRLPRHPMLHEWQFASLKAINGLRIVEEEISYQAGSGSSLRLSTIIRAIIEVFKIR